jgi:aspartate carbamoyltransferase catalytic subunit
MTQCFLFLVVQARGKYIIDANVMKQLRKDAVVLHPLPRVDEVSVGVRLSCYQCVAHSLAQSVLLLLSRVDGVSLGALLSS